MKRIIKGLILVLMIMAGTVNVHADESEPLSVSISIGSGESVLVKDGHPLITSLPVTFRPDISEGECMYRISTDEVTGFGDCIKTDTGEVVLYPDDGAFAGGRVRIMFENVKDDEVVATSSVYEVIFDITAPSICLSDPESFTGWFNAGQLIGFEVHDAGSGICRIVSKCNGKVTDEVHFASDDIKKDLTYEYTAGETDRTDNEVVIECFDLAGNSSVISFEYGFDRSVPSIKADGVSEGVYRDHDHVLTLTASDPDSEAVMDYVMERRVEDKVITTEVSASPGPESINLNEDGHYSVRAWACDSAGNKSEKLSMDFTVDTVAPDIKISGVSDNVDARSPVGVTIGISENMPDDSVVNITLTRKALGSAEALPIEPYGLEALYDERVVNISTDGEYDLTVCAKDGAGNSAYESRRFRIDMTAPDILVSGLSEGEVTSKIPSLRFSAGEMFYESTVLSAILEKKGKDGYTVVSGKDMVMRSAQDHMDIQPKDEGRYRLTCVAADRSGNTASSQTTFTVDYTPPVISGLDRVDRKFFRSFSLPAGIASFVSDATAVSAGAYINNEKINDDARIIEEGKYVLTILAEDEAGNVSEGSADFMVDHTSPQVVLSGFDREGNIKKGSLIKVSLLDEGDVLKSIRFNDRNISVETDNTANIAVDDYGEYTLSVRAEDEAGNITDTSIHTSCYLVGKSFDDLFAKGKEITVSATRNEKKDVDPAGLAIGLISVLSGVFGLTYRAALRH